MRRLLLAVLLAALAIWPAAAAAEGETQAETPAARWVLPENPTAAAYRQRYALSCEVAALKQALFHWDLDPSEDELMELLGYDEDPDIGFRGSLNANQSLWDYGAHAPALARVTESLDIDGYRFKTHMLTTQDEFRAALRNNWPIMAWVPVGLAWSQRVNVTLSDGRTVNVVPAEHAIVLRGYDELGFHVYDPAWSYRIEYAPNAELTRAMSYFDAPAFAIEPIRSGDAATAR